jgi:hypothetical protein
VLIAIGSTHPTFVENSAPAPIRPVRNTVDVGWFGDELLCEQSGTMPKG